MEIVSNAWAQSQSCTSRQDIDQALVVAAQAGSDAAFESLHALYVRAIYRVTFSITKNTSDAEDATQESFMRAYRGLKHFRKESQFFSWLMRIAINSSLMLLRRRRGQRELSTEAHSDPGADFKAIDIVDSGPNPEGFFHLKETYAGIERSVEILPPRLRTVAELRFLQEQSIREISGILGISNAATKSRLSRARKLMASKSMKHRVRQQSALRVTTVECLL
ncbi:MAG TPA: sigma-70 family RNA polymerase sigma factor [Acidobacteriaceae bacterium]|jgi:RNA polymerase sigma-70 factor (ECF subfamily)|nr:sigma-70 family RNA polymerase sigma factor [Acidobacteriaceae bacterium]